MLSRLLMLISALCLTCFGCFGQSKQERIPDSVIVALVNEEFEWPLRGFSRGYFDVVLDDNMEYVRFDKRYEDTFREMLSYFEVDSVDVISFFERIGLNRENDSFKLRLSSLDGLSRKVKIAIRAKEKLSKELELKRVFERKKLARFMLVRYSYPIEVPSWGGYIVIKLMHRYKLNNYEAIYMKYNDRLNVWYAARFYSLD